MAAFTTENSAEANTEKSGIFGAETLENLEFFPRIQFTSVCFFAIMLKLEKVCDTIKIV